jgi:hypothetical protein
MPVVLIVFDEEGHRGAITPEDPASPADVEAGGTIID